MKNYYFTTPVVKQLYANQFFDDKDAIKVGEAEVKRLTKEDKLNKLLIGYELKDEGAYTSLYITSCKICSEKHSLKEIDELSTNPKNQSYFTGKKYVISHKYKKTIYFQPIIFEQDAQYINPLSLEKKIDDIIRSNDISFINEVIIKYQNYPFLNKNLEVLEDALRQYTTNNLMKFTFTTVIFDLYYRLICNNPDSTYINPSKVKIDYNYNSMRQFGLFLKKYLDRKEKKKQNNEESKDKVLSLKLDDSCDQIKMPEF